MTMTYEFCAVWWETFLRSLYMPPISMIQKPGYIAHGRLYSGIQPFKTFVPTQVTAKNI